MEDKHVIQKRRLLVRAQPDNRGAANPELLGDGPLTDPVLAKAGEFSPASGVGFAGNKAAEVALRARISAAGLKGTILATVCTVLLSC
jgi:hypothetical protein